jgi:hypothetical protein
MHQGAAAIAAAPQDVLPAAIRLLEATRAER